MIKRYDVIRLKMPFPHSYSALAVSPHMYICRKVDGLTYRFIKCQTLKPAMIGSDIMKHYWDEQPNIARNPFTRLIRIDCDKEFITVETMYSDALKTTRREDVTEGVMSNVDAELFADGYYQCRINEIELHKLNQLTGWFDVDKEGDAKE